MGCAHARLRTRVDVRDLESIVRTGDLVLFSSKHAAAQLTKCFTASTWCASALRAHLVCAVALGLGARPPCLSLVLPAAPPPY